jgi:glycerol-3-phosphate cytidylyltransferase-like family protein
MPEHKRVYVDLVGDLFHAGHVEFLRSARAFGD